VHATSFSDLDADHQVGRRHRGDQGHQDRRPDHDQDRDRDLHQDLRNYDPEHRDDRDHQRGGDHSDD
jgi:hypothetical protein